MIGEQIMEKRNNKYYTKKKKKKKVFLVINTLSGPGYEELGRLQTNQYLHGSLQLHEVPFNEKIGEG